MKKMNKRRLTLIVILMVLGGIVLGIGWFSLRLAKEATITEVSPELAPSPEANSRCTLYTDEEYGFSLCYPVDWSFPEGEKVIPSQQHLYQLALNPKGMSYMVNIYDQPSPISLGSFVRDYFKDVEAGVSWSNDVEINDQEALEFVIPKAGTEPMGIGAVAFRKGSYILTISTPAKKAPEEDLKHLVNDETLVRLTESFQWIE